MEAINDLYAELSPKNPKVITMEDLEATLRGEHTVVGSFEDGKLVSMGTVIVPIQRKLTHTVAFIDDLVTLQPYLRHGHGRRVMEMLIGRATSFGIREIHLTSNDSREAAHALYKSLGFVPRPTNKFILTLPR